MTSDVRLCQLEGDAADRLIPLFLIIDNLRQGQPRAGFREI